MDPWTLIEDGHYAEAVDAFTKRLRRDKCGPNYCNRAIAYLNLREFDKALADFQAANDCFEYTSDGYLQSVGVAHWLAGRESEAVAAWQDLVLAIERGKIQYTDGAGGVESACLLWFAAVCLGQATLLKLARRVLKAKVKTKLGRNWSIDNWPGPIAMFLLGELDEKELRDRIIAVPIARARELCQAEFYIGVRALQLGDTLAARRAFRRAAKLDAAKIENELYLAKRESNRRGPRLTSRST
jgi:tetratricopeptide (TPR) repeat protein